MNQHGEPSIGSPFQLQELAIMKSAHDFVEALRKGLSVEAALASLPPCELRRWRIYLSFAHTTRPSAWYCRFHADDLCRTPLSRRYTYSKPQPILDIARRGHGFTNRNSCRSFSKDIARGRGGIYLKLTDAEYRALQHKP